MTRAILHSSTWWQRLRARLRGHLHRCRDCVLISTDQGMGGQCKQCGRIHGWMSRDEIERTIRMPHIIPMRFGEMRISR